MLFTILEHKLFKGRNGILFIVVIPSTGRQLFMAIQHFHTLVSFSLTLNKFLEFTSLSLLILVEGY